MEDLARRFERHVDRTGEHHLWVGARDAARGTGRLKVEGRHVTAHRHAWELANGALPPSARVLACPEEPACVRVDHLRIEDRPEVSRSSRARKGAGSIRQVRPGVWKLAVTAPAGLDGGSKRVHRVVHVRTSREAADELASFVAEVRSAGSPSTEAASLRLDDAVERFLTEHLRDEKGREEKTITGYRAVHRKWFASNPPAQWAWRRCSSSAPSARFSPWGCGAVGAQIAASQCDRDAGVRAKKRSRPISTLTLKGAGSTNDAKHNWHGPLPRPACRAAHRGAAVTFRRLPDGAGSAPHWRPT
jgi:hypothetical protein